MCGIAGIIHFNQKSGKYNYKLRLMSEAIKHRGPDAEGYYYDDNVSFAHRRLSVVDLSEDANQPMKSSDENIVIVFNGEIYNHQEIRKELEKEYEFRTDHSDTEVIIYAYRKWGIDCIHKFVGMFAFALYDKLKEIVFLVRDRLGEKPLYFIDSLKECYFSSEIQSFFNADILQKELNEEAVYHYLTFLTVNAPTTFYKNIKKVESGHYLEISRNNFKKVKYWDVADYLNRERKDTYLEACSVTENLLEKSMMYRNVADVPITIALSGGLDSSLNLYYSSKINPAISAINISYMLKSQYDESEISERYSKSLHVNFIKQKIDDSNYKEIINEYLSIQADMPTGDPNTILVYLISRITRANYSKVLLVGEGGDEIGGYPVYKKLQKEFKRFKQSSFIMRNIRKRDSKKNDYVFEGKMISKRHIHGFNEKEKNDFWLGNKEINSYKILHDYMNEVRDDLEDCFLRKVSNVEYKLRLPELILARIDYPSMASSIEARSPFMDHKLIEYSCSLPFNVKMRNGTKTILKNISKERLPEYIQNHPKIGFGMLLKPFLQNTMPIWFDRDLIRKDSPMKTLINSKFLTYIHKQHQKTKDHGYKMWILYALNKWIYINKLG